MTAPRARSAPIRANEAALEGRVGFLPRMTKHLRAPRADMQDARRAHRFDQYV
jgi:hypothetical protein